MDHVIDGRILGNEVAENAAENAPIFIHSGFRSGSTWFWNRFRRASKTCAYYEPFNEILETLTENDISVHDSKNWPSRHPSLSAPYYDEYRPLLNPGGGVSFYKKDMAIKKYFDVRCDARQQIYISSLVNNAHRMGKIPVLGFCRSLGRVAWFRRYCAGTNVVTFRRPWNQWVSYHRMTVEYDNPYFETFPYVVAILGANRSPYPDFTSDLFTMDLLLSSTITKTDFLDELFLALSMKQKMAIFLRVYMLETLLSVSHADEIVDMDRMSRDLPYRSATTERLRTLSGLSDLCFDDCVLPDYGFPTDPTMRTCLEDAVNFLDDYFATRCPTDAEQRNIAFVRTLLTEPAA
ncbi:MAG: hypothetical protein P4M00_24915 [Azospirillaceae bacterium]|nr:hypothetical protein [Azospirillaceae bacterium]